MKRSIILLLLLACISGCTNTYKQSTKSTPITKSKHKITVRFDAKKTFKLASEYFTRKAIEICGSNNFEQKILQAEKIPGYDNSRIYIYRGEVTCKFSE